MTFATALALAFSALTFLHIMFSGSRLFPLSRPSGAFIFGLMSCLPQLALSGSLASLAKVVDLETLFFLVGMMLLIGSFEASGLITLLIGRLSRALMQRTTNPVYFALFIGSSAAILMNDTICLAFPPLLVAMAIPHQTSSEINNSETISQKLNSVNVAWLAPSTFIISASANIGSGLSLVGNPQNAIIHRLAHLDQNHFFLTAVFPSVLALGGTIGLGASLLKSTPLPKVKVTRCQPSAHQLRVPYPSLCCFHAVISVMLIVLLILRWSPGAVAVLCGTLSAAPFVIPLARIPSAKKDPIRWIDFGTIAIFVGMFLALAPLNEFHGLSSLAFDPKGNEPLIFAVVTGASTVISNVPAVLLFANWTKSTSPVYFSHTFYEKLALISTLAGNFTLVASMANIIAVESAQAALRRNGISVPKGMFNANIFAKIALLPSLAAVIIIFLR